MEGSTAKRLTKSLKVIPGRPNPSVPTPTLKLMAFDTLPTFPTTVPLDTPFENGVAFISWFTPLMASASDAPTPTGAATYWL